MLQRVLDLRVPPQDSVPADSRGYEMSLEYMRHKGTIDQWARQHKGLDPITLPDGGGFGREHVRRSSHNATPSTRQVPTVRRWRTARGQVTRRRRNGSSSRISTWISGGLRTDRPSPQLTCKKRWSASSVRLIGLTSSSSTPVSALGCPTILSPHAGWGGEVTVGPKRWKARFQLPKRVSQQPGRSPLNGLDRAMYSELRIDLNQVVDVVGHDRGLEQNAARFLGNFGNDLLGPSIDANDQHLAPVLPTKDQMVLTRKDDVAIRSVLHPGIRSNGLYNHQEERAFLPMAKAKAFARAFR